MEKDIGYINGHNNYINDNGARRADWNGYGSNDKALIYQQIAAAPGLSDHEINRIYRDMTRMH